LRSNEFDTLYNKDKCLDFPCIIDIELTNHCNLNCKMCSRRIMSRSLGFMDDELFYIILSQIRGNQVGVRFIRWGEPFLHKNILDYIKKLKEYNIPVHITNNGMIINKKQIEEIVNLELDSIIFSMQGATIKEYEYMRENSNYKKFLDNLMYLIEKRGNKDKPYIQITSTMTERDKEEDIDKFKSFYEDIGVDKVSVGITNMSRLTDILPDRAMYRPCKEVYTKLSIDWNGDITACCGDYDGFLKIGNIKQDTLKDIWVNSEKLKSIRTILDNMDHRMLTLCSKCYLAYENIWNNTSKNGIEQIPR